MNTTNLQVDVDINDGLDFHRAKVRLDGEAAAALQALHRLNTDPSATPASIEAAKVAYEFANDQRRSLKPTDKAAIARILEAAR